MPSMTINEICLLVAYAELVILIGFPVSKVTLWRWEQLGRFPKRVKLAGTRVAWQRSEIIDWIRDHLNRRDQLHYCDPR